MSEELNSIERETRGADSQQRFVKRQILHLTLHKIWFDKIVAGEKTEEYRALTPHWNQRLVGKSYDEIHFRNGYSKNAPWMRVECLGIGFGEWQGEACYVLKLGRILEIKNHEGNKTTNAAC